VIAKRGWHPSLDAEAEGSRAVNVIDTWTPRAAADLALRFQAALLVVTCHRHGPRPGDGHRLEERGLAGRVAGR
jgi:hypothetical protein